MSATSSSGPAAMRSAAGAQPVAARLDHVTIASSGFDRSADFYDAALGSLGWARTVEFRDEEEDDGPTEAIGYGVDPGQPQIWLVSADVATASVHVALRCPRPDLVDAFFAAAIASGGQARQRPRRWEVFRAGYYGSSVCDPDGNTVEVFSHE